MSEHCEHCARCTHYDCMMERGEALPGNVIAYWPDGQPYAPPAEALERRDAFEHAREEAAAIMAALSAIAPVA